MVKKKVEKTTAKTMVDLSMEGVKNFINFAKGFQISSLSIKQKDKKITIFQNPVVSSSPVEQPEPQKEKIEDLSDEAIKSKYVGVFHLAPGIEPGKEIKQGALLAKIYSMKIEHQVKAEKDCIIQKILISENGPVDYGKPLFIIK